MDGFEPLQTFVGLDNFVEAARDPGYWLAFAQTVTFAIAAIIIQVPLALVIALILNNRLMFARNVYHILIFLPVITTTAVIGVVFDVLLMRFLDVITIQLRPGHHAESLQNRKLVMDAHERAALDEHLLIYTVSSGWRSGTYLILRPLRSLHDLDVMEEMHGKRYGEILGDDNRKRVIELFAAAVEREEEEYFAVDTRASHVTAAWAGSDSDDWLGRPGQAHRTMNHTADGRRAALAV